MLESVNLWRIYQGLGFMDDVCKRALKSFLPEIILGCHFIASQNHQWHLSLSATAWKAQVRPLRVSRHFIKEKYCTVACSFSRWTSCKDLTRIMMAPHDTVRISTESSDPQGKSLASTWTSASGEAFKGFVKIINLLARRRKSLYPWCRSRIRRNYDLTSE